MSYAWGFSRSRSRPGARPQEARGTFWTEQYPLQESSCRTHGDCRHCPDGWLTLRGRCRQTSRELLSSSKFRPATLRPCRLTYRGRLDLRRQKRRLPVSPCWPECLLRRVRSSRARQNPSLLRRSESRSYRPPEPSSWELPKVRETLPPYGTTWRPVRSFRRR